jgi:hypothetical protein
MRRSEQWNKEREKQMSRDATKRNQARQFKARKSESDAGDGISLNERDQVRNEMK